jgi:hypothetical protein
MAEINVSILIQAIKRAFEEMSSEKLWYKELGLDRMAAGVLMNRFRNGGLSTDKMAELLEAKGINVKID